MLVAIGDEKRRELNTPANPNSAALVNLSYKDQQPVAHVYCNLHDSLYAKFAYFMQTHVHNDAQIP